MIEFRLSEFVKTGSNCFFVISIIKKILVSITSISSHFLVAVDVLSMSTASGSRNAFHVYCQWQ